MTENIKYYIYLEQNVQGPYELEEIEYMELSDDTQICPEGSTTWIELSSLIKKEVDLKELLNLDRNKTPTKIGKYTIVKEIGRGGMGSVYLAIDEILNRKVAIKELKVDEPRKKDKESYDGLKKRFQKEARVLAQLNNRNIVSIFDSIEDNDNQYMIMEFLDGKDLENILKEKIVFPIDEAISIVSDTCLALNYIHNKDIIHRDIKPSNIIILNNGVVKLTDFGVTRDLNSATMTMSGSLVGTIAYASPEQDSRELDGRSDIFSLGIVLYELVTGQKPFTGDTLASVLLKIATKSPTSPSVINPKVHKMLEKIIFKAIEKSIDNRYASAMDMYKDLQIYKNALETNDLTVLNCENESKPSNYFASSSKTDSIPPGKLKQQDIISNLSPSSKAKAEELLRTTLKKPIPNLQIPEPIQQKEISPLAEQKPISQPVQQEKTINQAVSKPVTSKGNPTPVGMNVQQLSKGNPTPVGMNVQQLSKGNPTPVGMNVQQLSKGNATPVGMNAQQLSKGNATPVGMNAQQLSKGNATPVGINSQQLKKQTETIPDPQQILELDLDSEPEIKEKPKENIKVQIIKKPVSKIKSKSHVEAQLDKQKANEIKQILIPIVIFIFFLILFFIKQINFLDVLIMSTIVGLVYYDYYTETLNKFFSYSFMIISMAYVFLCIKSVIPHIENNEISPTIYYLLDFSLFLISFVIAFFILRQLDYLSINKIKYLRPIGGLLKSILAILSIITIVSFTDIVSDASLSQEMKHSKLTNNVLKFLPDVKLGYKTPISVGKYGVKIGRHK